MIDVVHCKMWQAQISPCVMLSYLVERGPLMRADRTMKQALSPLLLYLCMPQ